MRYLLLIHVDPKGYEALPAEEMAAATAECARFSDELKAADKFVAAQRLRPEANTICIRNGQTVTTDGPFAETKEHLGGFYMIHAKDETEALAWAAKCPGSRYGVIEVRAIWE